MRLIFVFVVALCLSSCAAEGSRHADTNSGGAVALKYFTCEIEDEFEIDRFSIKLDEESSKVSIVQRAGGPKTVVGIFSPGKVQFELQWLSSLVDTRVGYEFNRADLTVRTETKIEPTKKADLDEIPAEIYSSSGVCVVTTAGRSYF